MIVIWSFGVQRMARRPAHARKLPPASLHIVLVIAARVRQASDPGDSLHLRNAIRQERRSAATLRTTLQAGTNDQGLNSMRTSSSVCVSVQPAAARDSRQLSGAAVWMYMCWEACMRDRLIASNRLRTRQAGLSWPSARLSGRPRLARQIATAAVCLAMCGLLTCLLPEQPVLHGKP